MTSNEAEPTPVAADEGIQQIPAVIQVAAPVPAADEARDKLLAAIGAEAQHVAEKSAGQASAALAELARAYALVTTRSTLGARVQARVYDRDTLPVDDFIGEGVVEVDKFVK
ncbi:hypothetical protein [Streptomyces sp. NPDC001933]|uniref:hypothetical protein n=1 Tax=Streptomyces sp. NPDC001933 TaxID=3364626 RepID=UPI0036AB380A